MSDSLAIEPSPLPGERPTKPAPRISLGAVFRAALESLVDANSRRVDATDPLLYRFPPL